MDDFSRHYTLEFAETPRYLRVTVRADVWTPAIAHHYNRQLALKLANEQADRILLFRDVPMTLGPVAVFPLMSDFVEGLGVRRKVAVVNPFPDLMEDLKFVMEVAANRGGDYKLFGSIPEAEAWLVD